MFLVWRGNGPLIFFAWFICSILTALAFGQDRYAHTPALIGLAFFLAGLACVGLSRTILKTLPERSVIDAETGNLYKLEIKHTLFWLTADWWAKLFFGAAAVSAIVQLIVFIKK